MDRKNINRGFKKLRVWQDAVSLYILAYKVENQLLKLIESLQKKQKDQPFVWECHDCHEAVVIPGTYKNIHAETLEIDPKTLNPNTEVIRF